jgi:hypothetical protein
LLFCDRCGIVLMVSDPCEGFEYEGAQAQRGKRKERAAGRIEAIGGAAAAFGGGEDTIPKTRVSDKLFIPPRGQTQAIVRQQPGKRRGLDLPIVEEIDEEEEEASEAEEEDDEEITERSRKASDTEDENEDEADRHRSEKDEEDEGGDNEHGTDSNKGEDEEDKEQDGGEEEEDDEDTQESQGSSDKEATRERAKVDGDFFAGINLSKGGITLSEGGDMPDSNEWEELEIELSAIEGQGHGGASRGAIAPALNQPRRHKVWEEDKHKLYLPNMQEVTL